MVVVQWFSRSSHGQEVLGSNLAATNHPKQESRNQSFWSICRLCTRKKNWMGKMGLWWYLALNGKKVCFAGLDQLQCHFVCTSSGLTTEVWQQWARTLLVWENTWELLELLAWVQQSICCVITWPSTVLCIMLRVASRVELLWGVQPIPTGTKNNFSSSPNPASISQD